MSDTGAIFELFRLRAPSDWTQQELAEFYRVQSILVRCGLSVLSDRGLSDEGEPWFVFYNGATNDVVVHFARIDRLYVVSSEASPDTVRGKNLRSIVEELLGKPVFALARRSSSGPTLVMHPATLLPALVAASFLANWESDASRGVDARDLESKLPAWLSWLRQEFAVLSAVAVAAAWIEASSSQPDRTTEAAQLSLTEDSAHSSPQTSPTFEASKTDVDQLAELSDRIGISVLQSQQHQLVDDSQPAPNVPPSTLAVATPSKAPLPFHDLADVSDVSSSAGICALGADQPASFAQLDQRATSSGFDVLAAELDQSRKVSEIQQHPFAPARSAPHSQMPTEALRLLVGDKPLSEFAASFLSPGELVVPVANTEMTRAGFAPQVVEEATYLLATNLSSDNEANQSGSTSDGLPHFDSSVLAFLDEFTRTTASVEVLVGGASVVLVDTDPAHAASHDFGVRTWAFEDGSTITIVGIIPQLDLVGA